MKQTRRNIRRLCLVLCGLFVLLIGYAAFSIMTYGNRWFTSAQNTYARQKKSDVIAGDILDRNGIILAVTAEGKRQYHQDAAVRSAMVHAVGDEKGNVNNGAENFFSSHLYGFNMTLLERLGFAVRGEKRQGDHVYLTVDSRLAAYTASVFPGDKAGAVVVMNYETGEVLTQQSFPNFDPENITYAVRNHPKNPFLNRAVQELNAPGSTFKIVTAASALDAFADAVNRPFQCTGQLQAGLRLVTDAGTKLEEGVITSHGQLNLQRAFQVSCNNTFARIALQLGDEQLRKTAEAFGFNDNFLFRDLVVENSSYPTENRNEGEVAWTGAGQSALTATPMHMCLIAAAVANDGVMMEPRMLVKTVTPLGEVRTQGQSRVYRQAIPAEHAAVLQQFMRSVVTGGTGTAAAIPGVKVCGKTGSAEKDTQENTNAWFVGYLDEEKSPYAICVVVEDAGGGGSVAAPIARKIFMWMLENGYAD
ncbi:MAG: penicillin-binding protein 2 [Clostridiales bacterium]|nr:penicillin-binding protein 2 [Clostridiales bacterium]